MKMPPLPEPIKRGPFGDIYTAAQLRERDRQIVEVCAQICERMVSVSAVSYETGAACAAALRKLLEDSQ
jgi:hypothetical protein